MGDARLNARATPARTARRMLRAGKGRLVDETFTISLSDRPISFRGDFAAEADSAPVARNAAPLKEIAHEARCPDRHPRRMKGPGRTLFGPRGGRGGAGGPLLPAPRGALGLVPGA